MNNLSEEEKQAILEFKKWLDYEKKNRRKINQADELIQMQETILNLIKKQQKEIEEMQEELQMYVDTNIEENFDTVYMKAVADFKDKIRAKIKEIENVETDKISREEYNRAEFTVEILLELLEE